MTRETYRTIGALIGLSVGVALTVIALGLQRTNDP